MDKNIYPKRSEALFRDNEFTIGLVQMNCNKDIITNRQNAIEKILHLAKQGAQIICLPELFLTPYFCQTHDIKNFDLAESIPGPTTDILSKIAKTEKVVIVASLFEHCDHAIYYNTAAVIDADGTLAGIYRKMHIPHDPLFYEKYYFRPGDLGFRVITTRYAKLGILVCWDQWFPEAARLTALQGAEILIYPTAIGWHPKEKLEFGSAQYSAWETIQRSHAIANGLYVSSINRVGLETSREGELQFWGGSFICDPSGVILQKANHEDETDLLSSCSRNKIISTRRNWPFFRDRRTDAYQGILSSFEDKQ